MEHVGGIARQRFAQIEQVIIDNEMMRAGFAAIPYRVLRDTQLSVGARLAYAVLLMYAWQEGSCFPGQGRMGEDMGVSQRHLRRYLQDLKDAGYIDWQKTQTTNIYRILDVRTKLKKHRKSSS